MQVESINVKNRDPHGTRTARRLRKAGQVPGIMYGHGQPPQAISVDEKSLERLVSRGTHVVNIEMDGRTESCLLRDVQFDHVGTNPVHVDFSRIDLNERVTVKVPLELRGHAKGQNEGGTVTQVIVDLEVECLAMNIPQTIRVNIADLGVNQFIHVKELVLPEGVTTRIDGELIVASCREVTAPVETAVATAEAAAAPAEPEVIAKGKIEKEGEEGAEEKAAPKKKE